MAVDDTDSYCNATAANDGYNVSNSDLWRYSLQANPFIRNGAYSLLALNIVIGLAAILSNSLVFVAFYKTPSLRTTSNMFILSLTTTDLLTGLTSEPILIAVIILFLRCSDRISLGGRVLARVMLFSVGSTLQNLSLISAERYIAIFHSLRYRDLVTVTRCYKVIIGSWATWLILDVLFVVFSRYSPLKYGYITALVINIVFITVIYCKILREVRRIEQNAPHPVVNGVEAAHARETSRERKAAKTVGLIIGLLFLCYLPFLSYTIMGNVLRNDVRIPFQSWSITIMLSKSVINPLIYCWRKEEMRIALLTVLKNIARL